MLRHNSLPLIVFLISKVFWQIFFCRNSICIRNSNMQWWNICISREATVILVRINPQIQPIWHSILFSCSLHGSAPNPSALAFLSCVVEAVNISYMMINFHFLWDHQFIFHLEMKFFFFFVEFGFWAKVDLFVFYYIWNFHFFKKVCHI